MKISAAYDQKIPVICDKAHDCPRHKLKPASPCRHEKIHRARPNDETDCRISTCALNGKCQPLTFVTVQNERELP